MKLKKIYIGFTVLLFATIVVAVGTYLFVKRSSPYLLAKKYLMSMPEVTECVDQGPRVWLSFWGYSIHVSGSSGDAGFKFFLSGNDKEMEVFVNLIKKSGDWSVSDTKVTKCGSA